MTSGNKQSFFKKHFKTIAMIGILFIPTIYTTLFLGSMWDPYGNVDSLPVAIVNADIPAESNGKELAIGNAMVEKLKEKQSLDFHFVSQSEAEEGLAEGSYYMVISIPEDFSANAATLLDEQPKKMRLNYSTNPGTNYIASKMSESAMAKIEKEISASVTESYAETVFEQLGTVGDGFGDAADGAGQISDGVKQLDDGNAKITKNLQLLADSTLTFENGAQTLVEGISAYTQGAVSLKDGADQLNDGMDELSSSAKSGTKQLSDGSETLSTGLNEYCAGVQQAAAGSEKLASNTPVLLSGINEYLAEGMRSFSAGTADYITGVVSADAGAAQLVENNAALLEGSAQAAAGTKELAAVSGQILDGLQALSAQLDSGLSKEQKEQLETLKAGLSQFQNGVSSLNAAVSAMDTASIGQAVQNISTAAQNIGVQAQKMQGNLENTAKDLAALLKNHPELAADPNFQNLSASISDCGENVSAVGKELAGMNASKDGISQFTASLDTLKTEVGKLQASAEQLLPAAGGAVTKLQDSLLAVQKALEQTGETAETMGLIQAVSAENEGIKTLAEGAGQLSAGITAYVSGTAELKNGLDELVSNNQKINDGFSQLDDGVTALSAGGEKLDSNSEALKNGAAELSGGMKELDAGLKTIDSNSDTLINGAAALKDGMNTLSSSLTAGVAQLKDGSQQLYDGAVTLTSNNDELVSGAGQLTDGAAQINDGASQLADGSVTLGDGIGALEDGASELKTALTEGQDKVTSINAGTANLEMFASPIDAEESFETSVPTNGNAMAAYMMAVGLWVSGLAFCVILDPNKKKINGRPAAEWGKQIAELCVLAVIQAFIMVFALMLFNGFEPRYLGTILLIASLSSIAFLILEYTANYFLGLLGDFLLLVIMVIQLSGCAGTYPKELSSAFYQIINPFLPFSYAVHGFRSGIASGQSIVPDVLFMVLMGVIFAGLLLIGFVKKYQKTKLVSSKANYEDRD